MVSFLSFFLLLSFQGDLKQFLRISKSKDDKVKSQPISTKTKVSVHRMHNIGIFDMSVFSSSY